MINITHTQARRLIRQRLDRRLPDGQWAALQAHLETCEECRAYLDRQALFEREVQRALKDHWPRVTGPAYDTAGRVTQARARIGRLRKRAFWALASAAALLAFYLLGGFERLFSPPQQAAPVEEVAPPTITPLPTPQDGEFRGVIVFEAATAAGKMALFLLNPASSANSAPEQLIFTVTGAPDDEKGASESSGESAPAWSPDGEWLAFLSDRAGPPGKQELFVSNVAGSRVVQMTDTGAGQPQIRWEGPLSWSPDGQWIALTGAREDQGGQRWVYRVPVGAPDQGPIAVSGSRNGFSPEYSPYGDRLAFGYSDGDRAGVIIHYIETGETATASWPENPLVEPLSGGAALDWSADGTGLAYLSARSTVSADEGPGASEAPGSQVVAVRDLNYSISLFYDFLHNFQVARSRWPGAYRAVSWTPGGAVVYLEDLDDARANDKPGQTTSGCWTLQFRLLGFRGTDGRTLPLSALCVESGIDRSSWTPDGQWLVVLGRTVQEMAEGAPRGIYGVRIPRPGDGADPRIVRLGSVTGAAGLPRIRPAQPRWANPLNIDPRPVGAQGASPAHPTSPGASASLPADPSTAGGQVYYSRRQGRGSVIARMNPDGTGGRLLFASDGSNSCPSPAPNGGWVAFVSDLANPAANRPGSRELAGSPDAPLPTPAATPFAPSSPAPGLEPARGDPANLPFAVEDVMDARTFHRFYGLPAGAPDAEQAPTPMPDPNDPARKNNQGLIGDGSEVFLMDANGGGLVQLSNLENLPESGPRPGLTLTPATYSCPVWSPDGKAVAVVISTPLQWYLGVLPVSAGRPDPDAPQRFLRISHPAGVLGPQWVESIDRSDGSEGKRILLPYLPQGSIQPSLLAVRVPGNPNQNLSSTQVSLEAGWDGLTGLAVSPSGREYGWLWERNLGDNLYSALLGMAGYRTATMGARLPLGTDYTARPTRYNQLAWLTNDRLGMVLREAPSSRYKANIHAFDLETRTLQLVALVEDTLYDIAWSPDGDWVMYSTEGGLWVADVPGALAGQSAPVWLSPEPVYDLAWR